jgi:hypothetical protein
MDRDQAYRFAIHEAIKNIQVDIGFGIFTPPIYDSKLESDDNLYVLYASQTSQWDGNYAQNRWICNIDIEIHHRQQDSATFDGVDLVGEAVEGSILNSSKPVASVLVAPPGWQIETTILTSSNSIKLGMTQGGAGLEVLKILQFSSKILKL